MTESHDSDAYAVVPDPVAEVQPAVEAAPAVSAAEAPEAERATVSEASPAAEVDAVGGRFVQTRTGFGGFVDRIRAKISDYRDGRRAASYRSENVQVTERSAIDAIDHAQPAVPITPHQEARINQARAVSEAKAQRLTDFEARYASQIVAAQEQKMKKVSVSIAALESALASGKYGDIDSARHLIGQVLFQQDIVRRNYEGFAAQHERAGEPGNPQFAERYAATKAVVRAEELYIAYLQKLLSDEGRLTELLASGSAIQEEDAPQAVYQPRTESIVPYKPDFPTKEEADAQRAA